MAAKEAGSGVVRVCAVLFTSIVAPLMVNVACQEFKEGGTATAGPGAAGAPVVTVIPAAPTALAEHSPGQSWRLVPAAPRAGTPPGRARVIARGTGRTPEAALRDALQAAVRQAAAAQVEADTWARNGRALGDHICRDVAGLVLSFRDLGDCRCWGLTGPRHCREVEAEVDCRELAARLRVAMDVGR